LKNGTVLIILRNWNKNYSTLMMRF
jgi:hypothetical protein